MVVYVDVLFVLNVLVTYFLVLATKFIIKSQSTRLRLVFASLLGGAASLYILLPQQHFLVEIAVKLLFSLALSLTAFVYKNVKTVLRGALCLFLISLAYSGFMIAFWYVLKPKGMIINNGVVYFSVSPLIIILSAAVTYLVIRLCFFVFKRENSLTKTIKITFQNDKKSVLCNCMVDSGCTVQDGISGRKIAIIDRSVAVLLFDANTVADAIKLNPSVGKGFRLIPYRTLSSKGLLPSFQIERAICEDKSIEKVLVGITDIVFEGDFQGIVSPDFFE